MSVRIEEIDTRTAPEAVLRELHELHLEIDEHNLPGDPPFPWEQRLADWRNFPDSEPDFHWLLWDGDTLAATSGLYLDLEQNLDNAFSWIFVAASHRGQGLGRLVGKPLLDRVEQEKRKRLAVEMIEGSPFEPIARRAGMKMAMRTQRNRLRVDDIDWELVEGWIDRARERAADYEILFMPPPIADEHLEAYCRLSGVMNTAPFEDYERDHEEMTPERWRELEVMDRGRGTEFLSYVAIHQPTGELVGLTQIVYQTLYPSLAYQADTGVDPAHREKGLGRWLKAAMLVELRDGYPLIERIDTQNAGSNEPMLHINYELGFKQIQMMQVWQGSTATVRERLEL